MKDQMLEDKYNELGKAHAEAMNQLAKKDEIIKELKIYSDFLSQYSDCDDSCSWARHSSRCRSVTKRILDHKNKIEELENGK